MTVGQRILERVRLWLTPAYAWRRLRHNFVPKLIALGAAVVLWLLSTGDQRALVQQSYDVPITVRDSTGGSEQRAVSGLNPETVRVTLSGRPDRLRELRSANIEAVLDVTGVPEGSFNRPVSVTTPGDTTLAKQAPERVQGFVDTQLSRTVPIVLSVAAPPQDSLLRYELSREDVQIRAPGRVLSSVARVITSPGIFPPGESRESPLIALNAQGEVVRDVIMLPASVTVRRLDLGKLPVKTLPVTLRPPPAGLRVTALNLQPRDVRVVAAPALLGRLREVEGKVEYREGRATLPVQLVLPDGAQALEEVSVDLTVERVPTAKPQKPKTGN